MGGNIITRIMGPIISLFTWFFFTILCKGKINNIECLEQLKDKPFIITPNHISHMDWLVLHGLFRYKLKRQVCFLAKKELFESPFWKHVACYGKAIKLDRENVTKDVLLNIKKSVNEGNVIGIFPEGTRSKGGKLLKGKSGAIKLALMTKLPIVPIGLVGFNSVLPKGAIFPVPHECTINIGDLIYINRGYQNKSIEEITDAVMNEIAHLSKQEYMHASIGIQGDGSSNPIQGDGSSGLPASRGADSVDCRKMDSVGKIL